MKAGLLEKGKIMSKTITLSISKDQIARGVGKGVGLALDAGLGFFEGSMGIVAVCLTLASSANPIFKWTMAICEAFTIGYLSHKLNDYVFEEQEDLEMCVSDFVGQLIGADEDDKKVETEASPQFSVIG